MKPYPLVMAPILKERVWGGRNLESWGKALPPETPIGESWEIADLSPAVAADGCSRVANGPLAGRSLRELVTEQKSMLLGSASPTDDGGFPLLIKYLDAAENLSVQVHPSPAYAAAHPGAHLKSEAWVVLEARPGARLYAGIRPGIDADRFRADLEAGAIEGDLIAIPGRPGDCHYIPSGTCHALGAGLLVAEIQIPSDTTFRLWDWGRRDRELHTEQALACLDFDADPAQDPLLGGPMVIDGIRTSPLAETAHFAVERIEAERTSDLPVVTDDQPVVWMVTAGHGRVRGGGVEVEMVEGVTMLMPATLDDAVAALARRVQPASSDASRADARPDRMNTHRGTWIVALLAVIVLTSTAQATQHLVRAGHPWERLAAKVKPGDEIILMPGTHRPATLDGLTGTKAEPIIIRGLDPKVPVTIEGERYGLRLRDPYGVHIANLRIVGARINGIVIEHTDAENEDSPPIGRITIENVHIEDTGPRGQRHALSLQHIEDISIEGCSFEGWAGSAIEAIGCRFLSIDECRFIGKPDFQQQSGVRLRAGTRDVTIARCRFENTGDQGVCFGGGSAMSEFRDPPAEDAEPGTLFEASHSTVARSVFIGAECAVAFVNCSLSQVNYCTIVRPRRAVVSVRNEQTDPRFSTASACRFGSNLITWEPGELKTLTHLGDDATTTGIALQENLWWTTDLPTMLASLGVFPGTTQFEQVTDMDPQLDEELKPMVVGAEIFGANAP